MRIFIGGTVWRTVEVAHMQSMLQLQRHLDARKIEFIDATVVGDALVSRSRSIVASAFLRSDADVLLMIDSDMYFQPEDAVRLCEQAGRYGIIGALYMTRNIQTQPALMLPPDQEVTFAGGTQPVEVPYASTGFLAVHRRVFESLSKRPDMPVCHKGWNDRGQDTSFQPFFLPLVIPNEVEGAYYLSEDWAFVHRAKEQGFKAWIDPTIRLGHVGSYTYTLEDLLRPQRPQPGPLRLNRDADGALTTRQLVPQER